MHLNLELLRRLNMKVVNLDELSKADIFKYWDVYAVSQLDNYSERVFKSLRLSPFLGPMSEGTHREGIGIRVPMITDEEKAKIVDKVKILKNQCSKAILCI